MNEVLKAIQQRRSIRRFTPEPLTREQIQTILEAGRWAPSGKNTQPWRFVVVETLTKREEMAKLAPQGGMVATAPVTLAVLLDRNAGYDPLKDVQGIGAAIENILLAVHALGLGACWMGSAGCNGPGILRHFYTHVSRRYCACCVLTWDLCLRVDR